MRGGRGKGKSVKISTVLVGCHGNTFCGGETTSGMSGGGKEVGISMFCETK